MPQTHLTYDLTTHRTLGVHPEPPGDPRDLHDAMDPASWTLIHEADLANHDLAIRECPLSYREARRRFLAGEELILIQHPGRTRQRREAERRAATDPAVPIQIERARDLLSRGGNSVRKVAARTGLSKSTVQRLKATEGRRNDGPQVQ